MANWEQIEKELKYITSRGSGAGGQHINKVETRVQLYFDVLNSEGLDDDEKQQILYKLKNKLTKEGILIISAQTSRTQFKNKTTAHNKLIKTIEKALQKTKKRRATRVPTAQKEKRIQTKKVRSETKKLRNKPDY
jgi:ribosome-associated protein